MWFFDRGVSGLSGEFFAFIQQIFTRHTIYAVHKSFGNSGTFMYNTPIFNQPSLEAQKSNCLSPKTNCWTTIERKKCGLVHFLVSQLTSSV